LTIFLISLSGCRKTKTTEHTLTDRYDKRSKQRRIILMKKKANDICKLRRLPVKDAAVGQPGALMALDMAGIKMDCSKLPTSGQTIQLGRCGNDRFELANHAGQFVIRRK
jgi:hypothetical protein